MVDITKEKVNRPPETELEKELISALIWMLIQYVGEVGSDIIEDDALSTSQLATQLLDDCGALRKDMEGNFIITEYGKELMFGEEWLKENT